MLNSRNKLIYQIKYEYIATTFVPSLYGHEIKNQAETAITSITKKELLGMMYDIDQTYIGSNSKNCIITKRANSFAKLCKKNEEKYKKSLKLYKHQTDKFYYSILQSTDSLPLDIKINIVNKIKLT